MPKPSRIESFHIRKANMPLHTSFAISKGAMLEAANVFIEFRDDQGNKGIGEAAPFPVLTYDTQESCENACRELSPHLTGLTPRDALDKLIRTYKHDYASTPSAMTGIEMALMDLYARQLDVPFSYLFGYGNSKKASTDITLPIMDASETKAFWDRFANHNFDVVKIKVGAGTEADLERIMAFQKLIPRNTKLTLDGNQGCTVESSLELLEKLRRYDIVPLFFEQPLPADDLSGMAYLTEKSPVSICADETVRTVKDAIEVVRRKAAHMINLKITKSGIFETMEIISVSRAAGIGLMIGGMIESEIAMTASLHIVCGSEAISWCDLDTPFFLKEHPCRESPYHARNSMLVLPEGPGLGLTLKN